jgi:hypothetical protein
MDLSHVKDILTDLTISTVIDDGRIFRTFSRLKIKEVGSVFNNIHLQENLELPLPLLVEFSPTSSSVGDLTLGNVLSRNIE